MPYKANEARRHKIPGARYKITNWSEYDRALQQRGSLTVWVTPEALAVWHPPQTGRRGRSPQYADIAIETGHLLRLAFGGPWRQTGGLLRRWLLCSVWTSASPTTPPSPGAAPAWCWPAHWRRPREPDRFTS